METFLSWSTVVVLQFCRATNPRHESSNLSIKDHLPRHNDVSKPLGMEIPKNPEIDFEQAVQGRTFYSINSSPSLGDLYRSFSTVNCQNIICLAGGVCTEIGDSNGKCLCQMGTTGKYCEQEVSVKFPKFNGVGFIVFPVLRKAERSFVIKMEFKPESESGVLLFSADQPDAKFDFFSISLVFARVEFRYDCGSGMAVIKSPNFVLIDKWNQVTVSRNEWHGWLQLNNETQVRGKSKGKFSRINFQNDLYLGGHSNLSEVSDRAGTNLGFHGCVRSMQINDKFYDMRKGAFVGDAIRGLDVEECSAGVCRDLQCLNGGQCIAENAELPICVCPLGTAGSRCQRKIKLLVPMFSGSSFLQYVGLQRNVLSYTEIEIHFKPVHGYGLILYNGYAKDRTGDFISLVLSDGFVEFRFDLGTGPALLRSLHRITLGDWHFVRLSRTGRSGFLKVDDQQLVEGMASGAFTQLTLTLDLYLGGHRNFDEIASAANVNRAFQGCIQKVVINNRPMKLIDEAITGSNVKNCDHQCVEQPCQENGKCIPDRDSYFCSCKLGFVGDNCETVLKMGSESVACFNENSFLLYLNPLILRRTSGREFKLRFAMKAKSSNGLIFFVSEEENGPHGDYLSIGLRDGFLQMSFNLGSGDATILFNHSRVDDDRWHMVSASRRAKIGELHVDGKNVTRGMSPGDMTQLTSPGSIFLGGMEDLVHGTLQQFKEGFSGCLGNFTVGEDRGYLQMMAEAVEGANITPCLEPF